MANRISNLLMSDHKYIWKPFASTGAWMAEEPLIIEESRDCFIKDIRGHWYIDGLSSTWVTIHDRNRAEINDAIRSQLDKFAHPTLPIPGNVPSILLAERLAKLLRKSLGKGAPSRVSYAGDGATAIESALKMAFQYWQSKGKKRKKAFISFSGSYHGDTLGALSLSGIDIFRKDFAPLLFKTYFSHYPYCYRCWNNKHPDDCGLLCLEVLDKLLKVRQEEVAALIIEPLIQSEGGMIPAPEGFLSGVRSL
nr:aminotransferase class III-fold pyridoxal phosphate-dependent enzyme [Desulfobacterales bacterium]